MINRTRKKRASNLKTLKERKHPIDFFIADEVGAVHYRDELASMEHPFFALKGGDTRVREYINGNVTVTVSPNAYGMATIFDKDLWIYVISKIFQAKYDGDPVSRVVRFTAYDFFVTTNRDKGGRSYKELEKALNRLAGTRITTNIQHSDDAREASGFGLIDSWYVSEEQKGRLDIGMIEVTLPDWLYSAITETRILKISPDYFRIRKAIDRRLYEIARKHCGNQKEFKIRLELLHLKTGSTACKAEFKRSVKKLIETNDLPDYSIAYETESDCVIFKNCNYKRDESDLPKLKRDRSVSESIMREESDEGKKRREQMIQTADEIVKKQAKKTTKK